MSVKTTALCDINGYNWRLEEFLCSVIRERDVALW